MIAGITVHTITALYTHQIFCIAPQSSFSHFDIGILYYVFGSSFILIVVKQ